MEQRNPTLHGPSDGRMGRESKGKMFLYVIGSKGREIYETLHFEKARDERTLQDVINAFEEHWNLKKNETVERYKFFT